MHVITCYSWLSLPFFCFGLQSCHSLLFMLFFLSERHCGLEGNLHRHPIIPCLLIVSEWTAVDSFDVWKTFPGGKIVAEKRSTEEKERQTGVTHGAKVRRGQREGWVKGEVMVYGYGCWNVLIIVCRLDQWPVDTNQHSSLSVFSAVHHKENSPLLPP